MPPPEFIWVGDDGKADIEEKAAVVQRHYNEAVGILEGRGYDPLVTMKERLERHTERVAQEVEETRKALKRTEEDSQQTEREGRRLGQAHEKRLRTDLLLRFRLAVTRTVLYRYEAFGSVETMTEEVAAQVASEVTPTAEDILREFSETGLGVCMNWSTKKELKDWAVANVEPMPSPKTVERRLEDIGVWVKGKQGRDGSGLEATIQNLKDEIEAD